MDVWILISSLVKLKLLILLIFKILISKNIGMKFVHVEMCEIFIAKVNHPRQPKEKKHCRIQYQKWWKKREKKKKEKPRERGEANV